MTSHEETSLDKLTGISQELVDALKSSWINTAEQFVSASAASGGAQAMAANLGIAVSDLQRALASAESVIPPDKLDELKSLADTSDQGLGANPPDDEN